jgi:4-methyl-5(b-hydroxyethyl)-thiazole monophosphate biosynthesis
MKKAFLYFADGFEEIEAITIADVLRRAEITTLMVSVTGKTEVTGAHGIGVVTDILIEDVDTNDAEIIILPGGLPGADNLNAHKLLKDQIKAFNESGKKIAAICAAPQVLGGLNLLKGKKAVCYPGFEGKLTGAEIQYDPAVKSGNIITGRGPGTALDFALLIVAELKGNTVADSLARGMLVQTW